MGTTTQYALRYPELTDPPLVQTDIKNLASDVDAKVAVVPIGASSEWDYGPAQIPSWALLQYGQAVSRTTYPALHALASAASYPHGNGDGANTFNIADKRGRVSAGKDDMGGTAASRITAAISGTAGTVLGAVVGSEGVTLATGAMPSHSHLGNTNWVDRDHSHGANTGYVSQDHSHGVGDPGHAHNQTYAVAHYNASIPGSSANAPQFTSTVNFAWSGTGQWVDWMSADHTHTIGTNWTGTNHQHGITAQGGGGAHLNMQPTIIVNKIVRAI